MQIVEYTDKSFVIRANTKKYNDIFKQCSGRWNPNLKDGPGWIFSNTHRESLENLLKEKDTETLLKIIEYSDKSFVIVGDTKQYKEQLKELGGKWNPNLKGQPGWIFSKIHKDKVQNWIDSL